MHQRDVEVERRHGDQLLAVVVRASVTVRRLGLTREHVGAEPGPGRQERQPLRGRLQARLEHALVELDDLDRAGLAGRAEVRLERDRVERARTP